MAGVAVITGTTHGIGRVTARELAKGGKTVVMLCRDPDAGRAVQSEIGAAVPRAAIHVIGCDLASLASVRRAAAEVRRGFPEIALLINNAAVAAPSRRTSADGFELTFATNHLGPFLLTSLLLEHMTAEVRILNVASRIHYRARLRLDQVTVGSGWYDPVAAYAQSKLANVLFTFALARRLAGNDATKGMSANCLHPGVVATNLLPRWVRLVKPLLGRRVFDVERGAQTTLRLALGPAPGHGSGGYFDERTVPRRAAAIAYDVALQERLWERSEHWTRTPH